MRTAAPACAFRSASRVGGGVAVCAVVCALAIAGCTASAEDVRAPQGQLFFPTGIAVSPDESVLFIANANSELRFDSGTISVMDLGLVETVLGPWIDCQGDRKSCVVPSCCSQDPEHIETIICPTVRPSNCDESQFVPFLRMDAGVRIGNFATDISIQDFSNGSRGPLRVFVPTRGDPSISWADFDGNRLSCTVGMEGYAQCDDAHRLTSVLNDSNIATIPSEPYGVFADVVAEFDASHNPVPPHEGFAMVTHLSAGAITLIRAPDDSSQVEIVDLAINAFAPSLLTGIRGASGIAGRLPTSEGDLIYVGSNSENRVQTFTVGERDNAAAFLLPTNYFFLTAVGNNAGASADTRGIRFSPTGNRMYIANRAPPSLQVYDTSLGPTGVPRNTATGSSDICREASSLTVLDSGAGERAYVTCFQDGQVYVVDPSGQSQVEDIVTVGRGPYGVAGITGKKALGRKQLFVSNFLEDTIAVIDVAPGSPTRNRVVLRIGIPRAP